MQCTAAAICAPDKPRAQNLFINDNDAELTEAVLNDVYITAQVEEGVARYRAEAGGMSLLEVKGEGNSSGNLGSNMGDPRPHELCDAHAIVVGGHSKAAPLRLILAKHRRRIDDPVNECWLPHNTAAISHMPERLKNAVPHNRIHRHHYYGWLRSVLRSNRIKNQADLDKLLVACVFSFTDWFIAPGSYASGRSKA